MENYAKNKGNVVVYGVLAQKRSNDKHTLIISLIIQ